MSCYFDISSYAEQMDAIVELIFIHRHIVRLLFYGTYIAMLVT
jgi:hypothetical protein